MIHEFIRMQGAVEMLTHSATVNHGGGLRKAHEHVWANPVHYAHHIATEMSGGTPIRVQVASGTYATAQSFGHIPALCDVPVLDAMAVISADGRELIVLLVNRSASGQPIDLNLIPGSLAVGPEVRLVTLAGETMYDQNTLDAPDRIVPQHAALSLEDGLVHLSIAPFSFARLTFDLSTILTRTGTPVHPHIYNASESHISGGDNETEHSKAAPA
jgi:alpha-N-arabinofuranosidase